MSAYELTPHALDDIYEIWHYIARDNVEAADRVEAAIFEACELLSNSPLAGSIRKDLTNLPLRFFLVHPYSNYIIVYDSEKKPIQVIRVLHGRRNLPAVLT
jgi:plasmid stabilization system protein ParE